MGSEPWVRTSCEVLIPTHWKRGPASDAHCHPVHPQLLLPPPNADMALDMPSWQVAGVGARARCRGNVQCALGTGGGSVSLQMWREPCTVAPAEGGGSL